MLGFKSRSQLKISFAIDVSTVRKIGGSLKEYTVINTYVCIFMTCLKHEYSGRNMSHVTKGQLNGQGKKLTIPTLKVRVAYFGVSHADRPIVLVGWVLMKTDTLADPQLILGYLFLYFSG